MEYYKGKCGKKHPIIEGCWECDRINETDASWNAAIEEAAKCVEITSKFGEMGRMAEEIRRLKK